MHKSELIDKGLVEDAFALYSDQFMPEDFHLGVFYFLDQAARILAIKLECFTNFV